MSCSEHQQGESLAIDKYDMLAQLSGCRLSIASKIRRCDKKALRRRGEGNTAKAEKLAVAETSRGPVQQMYPRKPTQESR